eukprot:COSAG01_NODE_64803_length_275_cov_0.721591_1_plen_21_part_10
MTSDALLVPGGAAGDAIGPLE